VSDRARETGPGALAQEDPGNARRQLLDLVQYVDPLIGTAPSDVPDPVPGGRGGSVFPGAAAPFGMVQWSPDTPGAETSGYSHQDSTILAFSTTHYSGAGCANNGELPIMPALDASRPAATFRHENERARAGSYEVMLDSGIAVALTATERTGFARFSYPRADRKVLVVDASRTATIQQTEAQVEARGRTGLRGFTTGGRFCGTANRYRLYFAIELDQPFASISVDRGRTVLGFDRSVTAVQVKLGLSYVSVANAELNLRSESPDWNFEEVRERTRRRWNERLNAIQVSGGSAEAATKFYTALYHSLLFPKIYSDVNGQYLGFDNRTYTVAPGRIQYADYSGWDIYRSQVQLLALLFPREASDMMQSLVNDAEQCGALPRWSQNNTETGVMVGDPGALIVAGGHAFGAQDFDRARALAFMRMTGAGGGSGCNGLHPLGSLASYLGAGYIPADREGGGASTTLEYASRDFAVAQYAAALGDRRTHRALMARATYWRNLLHPSGLIQPRLASGAWRQPLAGPADGANSLYIEGNAEQYTWMVPHDARTLFDALGGDAAVVARLDRFFTRLNAGMRDPHFYIGNEPSFATPWLYNWAGAPHRTQDVVRRVMEESFDASPGGLPGNDDLGATSSWYVWAALGMYPVMPGVAGLALASPQFPRTTVWLHGRHALVLRAERAPLRYVQGVTLDGVRWDSSWLPLEAIRDGAELQFELGASPSTWGTATFVAPPSFGPGEVHVLAEGLNSSGISPDQDPAAADFDGLGNSYSRQALAAAGFRPGAPVRHEGITFQVPVEAGLDNLVVVGQTLRIVPAQRHRAVAFLGAASHGPASGTGEIVYADGTATPFVLGFSDWTLGGGTQSPSFGNRIALATPRRNRRAGGHEPVQTYLFRADVPVDPSREVAAIRLPAVLDQGRMHIFAVAPVY
jgi:predicted alpha-1,2-mannosidase